jgi:ubiquinone biosynthesis protein
MNLFKNSKLKRSQEILKIFFRFGLDYLIDRSEINFLLKLRGRSGDFDKLTPPERLRKALEELGPTFVKFGQILSTRPDLVPPEFVDELEKLQDKVEPFSTEQARKIVEEELGQPIDEVFTDFSEQPVASASLSQVHKAKLKSGEEVAVKIRRPNIKQKIKTDLDILEKLAGSLEERTHKGWVFHPKLMVREFKRTVLNELDFFNEAQNFEKFKNKLKDIDYASVPGVYWNYTSSKVLTMEFIHGTKISEIISDDNKKKFDSKKVAERGSLLILKQVYEDGFFHGDPHPGNLFVQPPAHIVLLDVGMVGYLDKDTRREAATLLHSVIKSKPKQAVISLKKLGATVGEHDTTMLYRDLNELFSKYVDVPLKRLNFSKMNRDMLKVMVRHNLTLPPNLSLMLKSITTLESIGKKLDPDFNMAKTTKPFIKRLLADQYSPSAMYERGKDVVKDLIDLSEVLPKNLTDIIAQARKGELNLHITHQGLEDLDREIDRASNQLSFSIIIAAIIVGSSLIIQQGVGPFIFGYSALGVLGFVVASFFGIFLVATIIGSGRWRG